MLTLQLDPLSLLTPLSFHDVFNHYKIMPTVSRLALLQTDSLLLISPYISKLTVSEIHAVMTAGLAGISGSMMGVYISFGVSVKEGVVGQ